MFVVCVIFLHILNIPMPNQMATLFVYFVGCVCVIVFYFSWIFVCCVGVASLSELCLDFTIEKAARFLKYLPSKDNMCITFFHISVTKMAH